MGLLNKNIMGFEPKIFGLDLSDLSVKVLELEQEGRTERIIGYGAQDIPPGLIEDGKIIDKEKVAACIREVLKKAGPKKISTKKVICSVPESKAFLRIVSIPKMKEEESQEAIKWEIEASIPLSIDQVYYDWQFIEADMSGKQNILTLAVGKETIDEMTAVLEMAGLAVYGFEVESVASARSLIDQKNIAKEKASFIIDLGSQRTGFIVVVKGIPYFTSSIPFSSESINDAIGKSLNLNFQEAEKAKVNQGIENAESGNPIFTAINSLLENLGQEIEKTLDFYGEMNKETIEVEKIILCGGGANLKGLVPYLEKRLGKVVELGNPWVNLKIKNNLPIINKENAVRYCTVVGLALRGLEYED
ncbi:MAG: type IV pilus assembly protein PilM [Parcubacteria group bacterium]